MNTAKKARYYITTYDPVSEKYTPQSGVRTGPYSLFGLRKAIRKLRDLGYPCNYSSGWVGIGDPSVAVDKKMIHVPCPGAGR